MEKVASPGFREIKKVFTHSEGFISTLVRLTSLNKQGASAGRWSEAAMGQCLVGIGSFRRLNRASDRADSPHGRHLVSSNEVTAGMDPSLGQLRHIISVSLTFSMRDARSPPGRWRTLSEPGRVVKAAILKLASRTFTPYAFTDAGCLGILLTALGDGTLSISTCRKRAEDIDELNRVQPTSHIHYLLISSATTKLLIDCAQKEPSRLDSISEVSTDSGSKGEITVETHKGSEGALREEAELCSQFLIFSFWHLICFFRNRSCLTQLSDRILSTSTTSKATMNSLNAAAQVISKTKKRRELSFKETKSTDKLNDTKRPHLNLTQEQYEDLLLEGTLPEDRTVISPPFLPESSYDSSHSEGSTMQSMGSLGSAGSDSGPSTSSPVSSVRKADFSAFSLEMEDDEVAALARGVSKPNETQRKCIEKLAMNLSGIRVQDNLARAPSYASTVKSLGTKGADEIKVEKGPTNRRPPTQRASGESALNYSRGANVNFSRRFSPYDLFTRNRRSYRTFRNFIGKFSRYLEAKWRAGTNFHQILGSMQANQAQRNQVAPDNKVTVHLEGYPAAGSIVTDSIKDLLIAFLTQSVEIFERQCEERRVAVAPMLFPTILPKHGTLEIGCDNQVGVNFVLRSFNNCDHVRIGITRRIRAVRTLEAGFLAPSFTITTPGETTWEELLSISRRRLGLPSTETWILVKEVKLSRDNGSTSTRFAVLMPNNEALKQTLLANPAPEQQFYPNAERRAWTFKYQLTEAEMGKNELHVFLLGAPIHTLVPFLKRRGTTARMASTQRRRTTSRWPLTSWFWPSGTIWSPRWDSKWATTKPKPTWRIRPTWKTTIYKPLELSARAVQHELTFKLEFVSTENCNSRHSASEFKLSFCTKLLCNHCRTSKFQIGPQHFVKRHGGNESPRGHRTVNSWKLSINILNYNRCFTFSKATYQFCSLQEETLESRLSCARTSGSPTEGRGRHKDYG